VYICISKENKTISKSNNEDGGDKQKNVGLKSTMKNKTHFSL